MAERQNQKERMCRVTCESEDHHQCPARASSLLGTAKSFTDGLTYAHTRVVRTPLKVEEQKTFKKKLASRNSNVNIGWGRRKVCIKRSWSCLHERASSITATHGPAVADGPRKGGRRRKIKSRQAAQHTESDVLCAMPTCLFSYQMRWTFFFLQNLNLEATIAARAVGKHANHPDGLIWTGRRGVAGNTQRSNLYATLNPPLCVQR